MRILVTGHLGYLGESIVDLLLLEGHQVVGLDTNLYADCIFNTATLAQYKAGQIETINVDIRDVVAHHVTGFDGCIHLAGLSNDPLGDLDPALTEAINHRAAVHLAQLCRDAGVKRFVAASSCSIYGAADDNMLYEGSAYAPVTPYAVSKLNMEREIIELANDDFSPVFLRGGTVYGMATRIRFDLVVNNLVAWASSTGEVLLKSDGTVWRPLIHVNDVALAFVKMLTAPKNMIHAEAFNLVPEGENYLIKTVAKMIAAQMDNTKIVFGKDASRDTRNYRVSGKKLTQVFGENWHTMSLTDGIVELVNGITGSKLRSDEFEGERYQRLEHLKSRRTKGSLDMDLRSAGNSLA